MKSISICLTLKENISTDKYLVSSLLSYVQQDYINKKIIVIDGSENPVYKQKIEKLNTNETIDYYHIPDKSSEEGFRNAITKSSSDYIMFGTISDGLIQKNWISECLNNIRDSVAIFGLSKRMNENGLILGDDNPRLKKILRDNILSNHLFFVGCQYILPELNTIYNMTIFKSIIKKINTKIGIDLFLNINSFLINNNFKISYLEIYANYGRQHSGQLTYLQNRNLILFNQKHIRILSNKSLKKIIFSSKLELFNDKNQPTTYKINLKHKFILIIFRLFYFRYHSSFPYYGLSNYLQRLNFKF